MSAQSGKLVLLVIFLLGVLLSKSPFQGCNRYTSFGYGYRDFFEFHGGNYSQNQVFYLEFYVKTSSDAHILLKPEVSEELGYEIVIGGGSNTFSQIRFFDSKEKKTVITQKTENFLSAEEYRSFWISIDKLGIVSVGKKEDDEVFINWRFDNPLAVKWFSFGSWTNMKADWRFGCEKQKDTELIHEEGDMSALRKLKHDLFTLYDPNALPVEKNVTLEVKVKLQTSNVQLDEKRGVLTMNGNGVLEWQDPKMKWKPEDYNGITTVYVPPFQIWTPNIRVLNALAMDKTPLFDMTTAGVMSKYDGSITWRAPFNSLSYCAVDLKYWPYDVQYCSLIVGFWMEPPNLVLTIKEEGDTASMDGFDLVWERTRTHLFNSNPSEKEENYGILFIELKRRYGPKALLLAVPYFTALVMSMTSFWVALDDSHKLILSCGSPLVLLYALFLAGSSVPAMTKSVPRIVLLYSWSVDISCIPVLSYIVLKCMPRNIRVPQAIAKILNVRTVTKIFCLPNLQETEYSSLTDEVNMARLDQLSVLRLLTMIERIFFLLYLALLIVPWL